MIRKLTFNSLLLVTILGLQCSTPMEPVSPDTILPELQKVMEESYYFYPDAEFKYSLNEVYAESLKQVNGYNKSTADMDTVIKQLQASGGDPNKISENTIQFMEGVFLRLPDHSSYFIDQKSLGLLEDSARKAGTGIVIRKGADGKFRIVDVLDGSPAQRKALPPGSIIESVDGEPVQGLSVEGVAARIRGPLDTEVELVLDGKNYTLVRSQFPSPTPMRNTWEVNGKKVLVIQLRSALSGAADDLRSMLRGGEQDALVLDLRKLNFGEFDEVFRMADLLVNKGILGSIKTRGDDKKTYQASEETVFNGRVFVLVGNSASPFSEVLAAALSGSPNVTLVGPRLKGNAFIADSMKLARGMLRLTTGVIHGPDEQPLHLTGIAPDILTQDYLPHSAPMSSPAFNDPAHQAVEEALK